MQQHGSKYFARRRPLGVKIQLFQNMVMLHIKLKGIANAVAWQQLFCLKTPPPLQTPGSKSTFFRTWSRCILNLRDSRMQQHGSNYFACRPPPPLDPGGQISSFSEHGHVAYQYEGHPIKNETFSIAQQIYTLGF